MASLLFRPSPSREFSEAVIDVALNSIIVLPCIPQGLSLCFRKVLLVRSQTGSLCRVNGRWCVGCLEGPPGETSEPN